MTPLANLLPVSLVLLTPVANLPPVSTIPAAKNGTNIRMLKKFETALMDTQGLGETDSRKKPEVENLVTLSP